MTPPALRFLARRRLATAATPAAAFEVFDRTTKRLQRDRAGLNPESRKTDYLKDEVADRLVERLQVCSPTLLLPPPFHSLKHPPRT